jgi:hypothetical protein
MKEIFLPPTRARLFVVVIIITTSFIIIFASYQKCGDLIVAVSTGVIIERILQKAQNERK